MFHVFIKFKVQVEKETSSYIKTLLLDEEGEYFSNSFCDFLQDQGIKRQITCKYTTQQNGVFKRKNKCIYCQNFQEYVKQNECPINIFFFSKNLMPVISCILFSNATIIGITLRINSKVSFSSLRAKGLQYSRPIKDYDYLSLRSWCHLKHFLI